LLGGAEAVSFMNAVNVGFVAFETHEIFVIKNKIWAFVKSRKNMEGIVKLMGQSSSGHITPGGFPAETDEL
jgi:hypothetical protein